MGGDMMFAGERDCEFNRLHRFLASSPLVIFL